ncbi:MAG: TetR/AcrR family transcriptional regulator [Bacteriovoracaceae bacterium]|nr:TetR/AcrR family transcriptional regulator [Bacteriovoracaceae bacterium]
MNEIRSSKEEKYHRVYEECLKLIHENGLRSVNHSSVARKAHVSRPWIYKYMGDSKEELIKSAVKYFGTEFTRFSLRKIEITGPKAMLRALWEGTWNNLEFASEYPFIIALYVRFAGSDNVLGQTIDELETLYLRRLKSKFNQVLGNEKLAEEAAKIVKAVRIGAALEFGVFQKERMSEEQKKQVHHSLSTMLKKLLKDYILESKRN